MPNFLTAERDLPQESAHGESRVARASFTAVSMLCMLWLAFLFGFRFTNLRPKSRSEVTLIRFLVLMLHLFALCLIFSAAILLSGLGLTSYTDCFSAIIVCLVFYLGSKILIYAFLVERIHILRSPLRRRHDKIWIAWMLLICLGFGSIAVVCFIWPLAAVSPSDGECRIGLPFRITTPLLIYDVGINLALTASFIWFLRPLLNFNRTANVQQRRLSVRNILKSSADPPQVNKDRVNPKLKKFLYKTLIGSILVMVPTAANLVILTWMKGHEQGWLCLTICSLDVTWAVTILHWLTTKTHEMEGSSAAFQSTLPLPLSPSTFSGRDFSSNVSAGGRAPSLQINRPSKPPGQVSHAVNVVQLGNSHSPKTPTDDHE